MIDEYLAFDCLLIEGQSFVTSPFLDRFKVSDPLPIKLESWRRG